MAEEVAGRASPKMVCKQSVATWEIVTEANDLETLRLEFLWTILSHRLEHCSSGCTMTARPPPQVWYRAAEQTPGTASLDGIFNMHKPAVSARDLRGPALSDGLSVGSAAILSQEQLFLRPEIKGPAGEGCGH